MGEIRMGTLGTGATVTLSKGGGGGALKPKLLLPKASVGTQAMQTCRKGGVITISRQKGGCGFGGKGGKPGGIIMPNAASMALPCMSKGGGATTPSFPQGRFGENGGFKPVKICNFWLQDPGLCTKGTECTFAHGVQELRPEMAGICGVSRFLHTGMTPTKF